GGYFGVGTPYFPGQSDASPTASLRQQFQTGLPAPIQRDELALALRRPTEPGDGAGGVPITVPAEGKAAELALDEEPRTWGVVAVGVTRDGFVGVASGESPGGAPLLALGRWPSRLRAGDARAARRGGARDRRHVLAACSGPWPRLAGDDRLARARGAYALRRRRC